MKIDMKTWLTQSNHGTLPGFQSQLTTTQCPNESGRSSSCVSAGLAPGAPRARAWCALSLVSNGNDQSQHFSNFFFSLFSLFFLFLFFLSSPRAKLIIV